MTFHKLLLLLLGLSCLVLINSGTFAQQKQGANWMFSTKIHLDFNKSKPAVDTFSFADTIATGVATISDKNGNLLFFSSSGRVATRRQINGEYQEMPNGNLMAGLTDRTTTSEMIVQSPADSNIYYLFYINAPYNSPISHPVEPAKLQSVQIDMRLNNGYGDVVPNSSQVLKYKLSLIKMTALLHSNNRDTWVVTQNDKNDTIVAHLVTPGGIMPPVETKIAQHVDLLSRMKSSPNSEMFVMNSGFWGTNISPVPRLELFDFNRATGVPTHKYSLTGPTVPKDRTTFLSFAFSPDNTKLYAGTARPSSGPLNTSIFQYDLAAGNVVQVQQSGIQIFNSNASYNINDMQLGIDGKIYFTVLDVVDHRSLPFMRPYLGQINCPDFYGAASRVKINAIDLLGIKKGGTLPALNQTIFRNAGKLQAQAYRSVICAGDTVQLSAYGAGAEKFKWDLANGLTAPSDTLPGPVVNPTVTTTYKVTGSSVCHSDTAYVTITVLPRIPGVTLAGPLQVVSLTNRHEYNVQNPAAGSTFNWQISGGILVNGQGQSNISVNWGAAGEGTVSVTEIPATGCKGEKVSLKVRILQGPEPVIYNIITPNNDGKNDAFVIENLKWHPENELQIFNRWGTEVYRSTNYRNDWKAENLSSGVYYYYFRANGKSWKGWVEVVK